MLDFDELYKKKRVMVLNYLVCNTKNRLDSEELTDDIFIKVFKHLEQYDETRGTFNTWLTKITSRTLIDYYRTHGGTIKSKAFKDMINTDDESDEVYQVYQIPYMGAKADSLYDLEFVQNKIDHTINNLKGISKDIAIESIYNDLNYQEISDKVGVPLGTIKGTLNRIREKLKTALESEMCLA